MRNLGFVAAMFIASVMNLIRVLLAATVLPQDQFGLYTSALGAVGLIGVLIGFGSVDTTTKYYPRLWVAGRPDLMLRDVLSTAGFVSLRVAGFTAVALLVARYGWLPLQTEAILVLGALCYLSVALSLVAAMIRSVGSMRLLVTFSILRGFVPLVLVLTVLSQKDWLWAIGAELAAAALVGLSGLWVTLRYLKSPPTADPSLLPPRDLGDGRKLYLGNLMSSSITLGDRALVTALLGPLAGGGYGLSALIVQSGNLLAGVMAQKFGPEMIRVLHLTADPAAMLRILRFPVGVMVVAAATVALVMLAAPLLSPPLAAFLTAREIGPLAICLSSVLVILQVFALLQFAVVAQDNEAAVIRSSFWALVVFGAGFATAFSMSLGIEGYIMAVLTARLVQALNLIRAAWAPVGRKTAS